MIFRGVIKSSLPVYFLEVVRAQRQLAPVYQGAFASWLAAFSPAKQRALKQSRLGLLPDSLRGAMDFVIDIGANEGQWSSALTSLIPIQQLMVFEPNPAAMLRCKQHLARHKGIIFHGIALGSERGPAVLHVTKSSDFSSLLDPNNEIINANYTRDAGTVVAEQLLEVFPLDEFIPADKTVDLLKVDVQGYEREVLAGAVSVLRRTRAVLIETNFQSHYTQDFTFFGSLHQLFTRELGFSFWNLADPFHGKTGQALWSDAVFINPALVS